MQNITEGAHEALTVEVKTRAAWKAAPALNPLTNHALTLSPGLLS